MPRRPDYEVADVIRRFGPAFRARGNVPRQHLRTLAALEQCRTAALGGHLDGCTECGAVRISYNSCRNRHCPKCGGLERSPTDCPHCGGQGTVVRWIVPARARAPPQSKSGPTENLKG